MNIDLFEDEGGNWIAMIARPTPQRGVRTTGQDLKASGPSKAEALGRLILENENVGLGYTDRSRTVDLNLRQWSSEDLVVLRATSGFGPYYENDRFYRGEPDIDKEPQWSYGKGEAEPVSFAKAIELKERYSVYQFEILPV